MTMTIRRKVEDDHTESMDTLPQENVGLESDLTFDLLYNT